MVQKAIFKNVSWNKQFYHNSTKFSYLGYNMPPLTVNTGSSPAYNYIVVVHSNTTWSFSFRLRFFFIRMGWSVFIDKS